MSEIKHMDGHTLFMFGFLIVAIRLTYEIYQNNKNGNV